MHAHEWGYRCEWKSYENICLCTVALCRGGKETGRLVSFNQGGKETGRLVSSNRGDLIGTILQQLSDAGISPPPPPRNATAGAAQRREARTARPKRNPWK
eukprot:1160301-Pelagomonas_calceolata.AAC.4